MQVYNSFLPTSFVASNTWPFLQFHCTGTCRYSRNYNNHVYTCNVLHISFWQFNKISYVYSTCQAKTYLLRYELWWHHCFTVGIGKCCCLVLGIARMTVACSLIAVQCGNKKRHFRISRSVTYFSLQENGIRVCNFLDHIVGGVNCRGCAKRTHFLSVAHCTSHYHLYWIVPAESAWYTCPR